MLSASSFSTYFKRSRNLALLVKGSAGASLSSTVISSQSLKTNARKRSPLLDPSFCAFASPRPKSSNRGYQAFRCDDLLFFNVVVFFIFTMPFVVKSHRTCAFLRNANGVRRVLSSRLFTFHLVKEFEPTIDAAVFILIVLAIIGTGSPRH